MKSLIVIFVVLIVGIIFIALWDYSSTSSIDETNYNELAWRLPVEKEIKILQESFSYSDIAECADYYIKKLVGEKYLVACDTGNDWEYYTAYTSQGKIYLTPRDVIASLDPPKRSRVDSGSEIVRQTPSESKRSTPTNIKTVESK